LRAVGGVGIVGLAGCSGDGSTPTSEATPTATESTPGGPSEGEDDDTDGPGAWRSLDADAGHTSANPAAAGPNASPTLETVFDQPSVENILTAPAVADDTLVYLDESQIRAVSLDGEEQWSFGWGGEQSPLPTPAIWDGTVYFPTSDALVSITDGGSSWSEDLPAQPVSSPIVTADGIYLLTEGEQYTIVSYDHEGTERFRAPWDEPLSRPSVDGSTLYHYRERQYDPNQLVARDATDGGVRWTKRDFETSTIPVAADGSVYCFRPDRYGSVVVALSAADGAEEWTSDVLTEPVVGTPAIGEEAVYVATTRGVRAFARADGSAAWEEPYTADSSVTGQPRVDGRSLYLTGGDTAVAVGLGNGQERWSTSFGTDGDPGVLGIAPVGDRVYATTQRKVVALA
jgi:outer membrane protein assembly factor BamB